MDLRIKELDFIIVEELRIFYYDLFFRVYFNSCIFKLYYF